MAQARGVAVILNDRPDLAVALGCDGAHVGQDDTPAVIARKVLGELTLGVTCHDSRDLAMEAGEAGADYVAFGAFFPTGTKQARDPRRPGHPALVVGADGAALRGDRRHHGGELCAAGAGRGGFPGRGRRRCGAIPDGPAAGVRAMNAAIARLSFRPARSPRSPPGSRL